MKQDLTSPPDLTQEKRLSQTRTRRPLYVELLPPCNQACPAGENIQAWLTLAQEKRFKAAWQKLIEENPMPAIHGRVCYHPCESGCNRGQLDAPVSIHAVERYLGDQAIKKEGPLLEAERRNIDFFETLPDVERNRVDFSTVCGVQFLEPLFEFPGSCAG